MPCRQGEYGRSLDGIRSHTGQLLTVGVVLIVALLSLWLRVAYLPYGIWASYDDALFVRIAERLAAGEWLGPYDHLVLAKGAFFPIFLWINQATGLPLKVSEHVLYLSAALLAAMTLARLTGQRWLLLPVFVALAFSPTPWMLEGGSRVTREPLYLILALSIVCLAGLYFLNPERRRWQGTALGFVGGCYWLTREEGVWLLPMFVLLLLPWLLRVYRAGRSDSRMFIKEVAQTLFSPVISFLLVVVAMNFINFQVYGVFRNNDLRSGPFADAYGALARIRHGEWRRYVVFPKESRQWAYQVSPAARELAPYLDGGAASGWVKSSQNLPRPWGCKDEPRLCNDEILSAWFVWALRDAASVAGHYRSAADADAYYIRLAKEVNAACDSKAIPCRERRATLAPVWRGHYLRDTLEASGQVLMTLLHLNHGQVGVPASVLTSEQARIFQTAINSPVSGLNDESATPGRVATGPGDETRLFLTQRIGALYAQASPVVAVIALASYFFLLVAWARVESARVSGNSILVLTALAVAIGSRIGLLGFLEATSIPSNNLLYLLPVVPLYLMFIVVSTGLGAAALANIARSEGVFVR